MKLNGKEINLDYVFELYDTYEYPLFTNGDYNLNIFGIRNDARVSGTFDDVMGVLYKERGLWELLVFPATVDCGVFYMKSPMNPDGAAFVKEGFYRGLWKIGGFKGVECLIQKETIQYYRDNNRDDIIDLDPKTIKSGNIGIFCHPHFQNFGTAEKIYNSSAGCQVPKDYNDFKKLMELCKKSEKIYGNSFSYSMF